MGLAGHNLRRRMEEASEAANKAVKDNSGPTTQETKENASTGRSEPQNEVSEPKKKAAKKKK